jgi:hypothetical protein
MNILFPSPVSVSNTTSNSNDYTTVVSPQKNKKRTTHHFTWPNISQNDIADLARSWWKKNKKRDPLQDPSSKRHWWCTTHDDGAATVKKPASSGLMYVKVPKSASSTMAGITLRIAHRHGRSIGHNNNIKNRTTTSIPCQAYLTHGDPIRYQQRNKTSSFLFATIRDPAHRAISDVF